MVLFVYFSLKHHFLIDFLPSAIEKAGDII
jgi:hypothetical protein